MTVTTMDGRIAIRSKNVRSDLFMVEIQVLWKGIAPGVVAGIFEPFEQGERSEGLGLGLAICKSIVELHGGRIAASSPGPGKGAIFVVEIPAMKTDDK